MDVELLDNIIEEATDDLLMQDIRPESEWMATLTFHFITNRIYMLTDGENVISVMKYICMMTFGKNICEVWNPITPEQYKLSGFDASGKLYATDIYDNKIVPVINAMVAKIPLSFESIREVSCFLNLIARAFASSLDCIKIVNGAHYCELSADQIHKIHQMHYYPEQNDFGQLYRTLVEPWFTNSERKRKALEDYYGMSLEHFILKQSIIPSSYRNGKEVELPFSKYVLGKRVTQPELEERVMEITHGWLNINRDKMSDYFKNYFFNDEIEECQSRIRHMLAYDCGYICVLILLRGPVFLSDKIWISTVSLPMSQLNLTIDDFKTRLKTYNLTLLENE